MFARGQTVIQYMEQFAPKHLAMEGDKIGLQVGTLQKDVKKVMVTLDVVDEVVEEAIRENVDLIIAHHAVIFHPLKHLRTDLPAGRLYEKLIKHDISVYVAHTNLDVAPGGINDLLAQRLGLINTEILDVWHRQSLKKIVVFIPRDHVESVMNAMADAGAGWIGNYSHCTFQMSGTGTFMPREGTDPFIGTQGKLEQVDEVRLETIVPDHIQTRVIRAMERAHPYEEVAYDVYPVEQKGAFFGLGRIGELPQPVTLEELAHLTKKAFDVPALRVVGPLQRQIKKVAVVGGDGNRYVSSALMKGADVLITGDIYYHTAQEAEANGLCMIDPGHNVEKVMKEAVADVLRRDLEKNKYSTEVIASQVHTDPFTFV